MTSLRTDAKKQKKLTHYANHVHLEKKTLTGGDTTRHEMIDFIFLVETPVKKFNNRSSLQNVPNLFTTFFLIMIYILSKKYFFSDSCQAATWKNKIFVENFFYVIFL